MHNPESALENEMRKLLWDYKIQTDPLILASQPDLVIVKRKKPKRPPPKTDELGTLPFRLSIYVKLKESEKRGKYLDLAR